MSILDRQRALFRLGYDPGLIDGIDGPATQSAVRDFLAGRGFMSAPPTAINVDTELAEASSRLPPLILARNFTRASRPHSAPIDLIVIHTMEAPEKPKTARAVAMWFAGPSAPQASAHYGIDDEDVVACVLECDVAWHAPGANRNGIGLEHAGFASQTPAQWEDDYSRAVLSRSSKLAASLCERFGIPAVKLSADELIAGARGFCGHVDVSRAFKLSDHCDPGPFFPWDRYLAAVRGES